MSELALAEQSRLDELERVVEAGLQTFVDVGAALLEIRDGRLYRETADTFEAYCADRWAMTHRHANRLVQAAQVLELTGPTGPANEAQARELMPPRASDHPNRRRSGVANGKGRKLAGTGQDRLTFLGVRKLTGQRKR